MSYFLFLRGHVWSIDGFKKTKHMQRCQHFCVSCWALFLLTQLLIDLIAWISSYRRTILLAASCTEMSGLYLASPDQAGKEWDAPREPSWDSGGADHWKTEWALCRPGASLSSCSRRGSLGWGRQVSNIVLSLPHVANIQPVLKCLVTSNSLL